MKLAILTILVVAVGANIQIEVLGAADPSQCKVNMAGIEESIISDEERATFDLTDRNLKQAVNAYFGMQPDDAFLKDPTPFGNLYSTYNWPPVKRTLKPLNAKILNFSLSPKLVLSTLFNNTSSTKTAKFKTLIQEKVENTVSSIWYNFVDLTLKHSLSYNIGIIAMGMSGKAEFSFDSKWGSQVAESQTVTVGSLVEINVELLPKQDVMALLSTHVAAMKVEFGFEATLSGSVAVNYGAKYKDHHYWSFDVNEVMNAGNLPTSVIVKEVIDLNYYTDSKVELQDINEISDFSSFTYTV